MRRFEHPSGKFWSVRHRDRSVHIQWGKLGTTGQGRQLGFPTEAEAAARAIELMDVQLDEGYVEVVNARSILDEVPAQGPWLLRFERAGGRYVEVMLQQRRIETCSGVRQDGHDHDESVVTKDHEDWTTTRDAVGPILDDIGAQGFVLARDPQTTALPVTVARNRELEAECFAAPDDAATWHVYADWLMANGDVRGELAALHAAGRKLKAEKVFRSHRDALFGGADVAGFVEISNWRHGFVTSAMVRFPWNATAGTSFAEITAKFLASPLAQTVTMLQLTFVNAEHWAGTIEAIASSPIAAQITALNINGEATWASSVARAPTWAKLVALTDLELGSQVRGLVPLPQLVKLSCGADAIETIASGVWPQLESLVINFSNTDTRDDDRIARLLDAAGFDALHRLELSQCMFVDGMIRALARSPLLPHLRAVKVTGRMKALAAKAILAQAEAFRHLETFEVSRLVCASDLDAKIRARLPNLRDG